MAYNCTAYLQQRHGFPLELTPNIAAVEAMAVKAGE
jgi:hypothetical protein